jgi:hypothetical protein
MAKLTRIGQRYFTMPKDTNFPVRAELVEALFFFSTHLKEKDSPSTSSGRTDLGQV